MIDKKKADLAVNLLNTTEHLDMNSLQNIKTEIKPQSQRNSEHHYPVATSLVASSITSEMKPETEAVIPQGHSRFQVEATPYDYNSTSKYYLPQAWADFLRPFKWDWFMTIAPADLPHPETLDKLFDLEIHKLNHDIYGRHYWKDKRKGVFWARGLEYQRRGAPHIHALVGGIPDYVNPVMHRNFLYSKNAMAKIEPYIESKGAEYYMSKSSYAWKKGEIDCSKTLVHESEGKRICGKHLHEEYCARYTSLTKPEINHFAW